MKEVKIHSLKNSVVRLICKKVSRELRFMLSYYDLDQVDKILSQLIDEVS